MRQRKIFLFVFISCFFLKACSEVFVGSSDEPDIRISDFKETWSVFNEWYPYFQYKEINWDSLYDVYYPKILESYSDEYFLVLHDMLLQLKDGHVALKISNYKSLGYKTPRQIKCENSFDLSVTKTYLDQEIISIADDKILYGTISEIGYVRIPTFSGTGWVKEIDKVIETFIEEKALIIDVRHNGGGSTKNAGYIVSKCITDNLQIPGYLEKGEYFKPGAIVPANSDLYLNPIVVLINGKSFSSTEHFAMWMKKIENVFLVGDTTAGASGNPFYHDLPSGNKVRVCTRFFYKYNGDPIEWNGIVPDVVIEQTSEDIKKGIDIQLEAAINYLNNLVVP